MAAPNSLDIYFADEVFHLERTPIFCSSIYRRVRGIWRPNVMAVISDAFHLKQRVTEAFGIVQSKFIGPLAF
jgi:hypothetical protein